MRAEPLRTVTDAERDAYRRDGVVCLRAIYPADWVDRLRRELDDVFGRSSARSASAGDAILRGDSARGATADVAAVARRLQARQPALDLAVEPGNEIRGRSIVETDACGWHAGMRRHDIESPLVDGEPLEHDDRFPVVWPR